MDRNEIESDFRTIKMATGSQNLSKIFKKIKVVYRSEMTRNAIESEIRTSKMADVSHFVKNFKKKIKLCIDVKWIEMRSKVIFGQSKWPPAAIL